LAIFYVLGIAIVFSALGLLSGLAGRQWGFLFQNTWFVIFITVIILAMAASMFGAFEITVPSFIMTRAGKGRRGFAGSFVMGLTAGVVIAPCAAGIVMGLVGIIAKLGLVIKGTLLFFAMVLGLGLPYLFLALFSGMMNKLPQAGMWMVWIRKLFGVLLVGVALYFLIPQAKQLHDQLGFYMGVLGIFGGILLGFLDQNQGYTRGFKVLRSVAGCVMIVVGIGMVNGALHDEDIRIDWTLYQSGILEKVAADDKPCLIDFYADWCIACRELDTRTFSNEDVAALAETFVMLRVDCTAPSPELRRVMKRFRVSGLPTIIFLDKEGEEVRDLRVVGFVEPDDMLKRMEKTLSPQP
jgi:thiol:disulfide interchange protein DsbD